MDNSGIPQIQQILSFTTKFKYFSTSLFLTSAYCILAIPFLVWHERHLPGLVITLLVFSTLLFSAILIFFALQVFFRILEHGFHPIYEAIVLGFLFVSLAISGFLENRAGRIFLFFYGWIAFLLRFTKVKFYYSLTLLGMLLLANGLLSFIVLQRMEIFTAYYLFRSRFQFREVDLSDWNWNEEKRILTNRSIPLQMYIPNGLYFHNPKYLSTKDKTGSGQIAGILSQSERDPNSYPMIRIFFLPVYVRVTPEEIKREVEKYNEFLVLQGEIEDVSEIQPNREYTYKGRIPPNAFWTFYDILRPRYSKTGYYFLESVTGSRILLHITENLEKGKFHEPVIQEVLDNLSLE